MNSKQLLISFRETKEFIIGNWERMIIKCFKMTLSFYEHLDSYMFVSHDQEYLY